MPGNSSPPKPAPIPEWRASAGWRAAYQGRSEASPLLQAELVARRDALADQPVLDLCCGAGALLQLLVNLGYRRVVGLDWDAALLSQVSLPGVELVHGDARQLPLPDGQFALAIVSHALHHFYAPEQVLREVRRVLRPEGVLLVLEPRPSWLRRCGNAVLMSPMGPYIPGMTHTVAQLRGEWDVYSHWLNAVDLPRLMVELGGFTATFRRTSLNQLMIATRLAERSPSADPGATAGE